MSEEYDDREVAKEMFETFHSRTSRRKEKFSFGWPKRMQEIGRAQAQLYRSNKWKSNLKEFEDYKHVAEAPQYCYAVDGFLQDAGTGERLKTYGPWISLGAEMPQHFTILAPLIGVQVRLYGPGNRLPRGDNGLYEVAVPRGMLGGGRFVDTEEAFLFVYTKQGGVHLLITGKELDVLDDGIVG